MPRKPNTANIADNTGKVLPAINDTEAARENHVASSNDSEEKQVYQVKEALTPNMYVTVRNGFNGKLVYKSKRTNEKFVWDEFGAEQDIELQELKSARNSSKAFFEKNWFLIDNPEVIAYLGVERFYRHALRYDNFDELFQKKPDEITEVIAAMPDGQKQSVIFRARQLIKDGAIDSIRVINVLESSLGLELIER